MKPNEINKLVVSYKPGVKAINLLKNNKMVLMVSASSTGKNAITDLLTATGKYSKVITDTTRPKRINNGKLEGNGIDYWFISEKKFIKNMEIKRYLETAIVHKNYLYGSSLEEMNKVLNKGKIPIINIDINGCDNITKLAPFAKQIFILPPSFKEWMKRLMNRGPMNESEITNRLNSAIQEITLALQKPYFTFFVNRNLSITAKQIDEFIEGKTDNNDQQEKAKKIAHKLVEEIKYYKK